MDDITYQDTRLALHAVGELLIAGPQYRRYGTIRLRVVHGGFGGAQWPVSVVGTDLVWPEGRVALAGTFDKVAATAGFQPESPAAVYADTTGVDPGDQLAVDPEAARIIADWFALGDSTLRCTAPDVIPVLWPEHFDLSSTVNEVNYGVSPGDSVHPGPYAYVGPWAPRTGEFWNAPFGAVRAREEVDNAAALLDFFEEGKARAAES
ncbi:hypothetical protein ACQP2U_25930 [Nocardia sp. CA-084685]|uniref:hypothetical protein n=1 Tax=Nocardia sp. CA-084685 TaxID=3239970 RepID=UPI003D96DDD5